MNEYWGELPSVVETNSGIIAVERAELMKMKPMKDESIDCDTDQTDDSIDTNGVNHLCVSDIPIGNPFMTHTIKLLQFMRNFNNNSNNELISRESVPQMSESDLTRIDILKDPNINHMNISEKAVKLLLRRAIILITTFYGYESTTESILDLLIDIMSEYLSRMCQTLRSLTDSTQLRSSNDFVDVIDRVFHDMNVPDFESLRQYDLEIRLNNQNLMKEVMKKMSAIESMSGSTKSNSSEFSMTATSEKSIDISVKSQSDSEPTLSLISLLNSNKSDESQENCIQNNGLISPLHI